MRGCPGAQASESAPAGGPGRTAPRRTSVPGRCPSGRSSRSFPVRRAARRGHRTSRDRGSPQGAARCASDTACRWRCASGSGPVAPPHGNCASPPRDGALHSSPEARTRRATPPGAPARPPPTALRACGRGSCGTEASGWGHAAASCLTVARAAQPAPRRVAARPFPGLARVTTGIARESSAGHMMPTHASTTCDLASIRQAPVATRPAVADRGDGPAPRADRRRAVAAVAARHARHPHHQHRPR